MRFSSLSTELMLIIGEFLDFEEDLHALSLVDRGCYAAINPLLYQRVVDAIRGGFNSSALEWAAKNGKTPCVRKLLEAGVPPSTVCRQPWHPIVLAAENGHRDTLQLFLDAGVDPSPLWGFNFKVEKRPQLVEEDEEYEEVSQQEDYTEEEEDTEGEKLPRVTTKPGNPLTFAIKKGQNEIAHLLIEQGVKLEFEGYLVGNEQPFNLAAKHSNASITETLLRKGCSPFLYDNSNMSAHSYAATHGTDLLQIFTDASVDPALCRGTTALFTAVQAGNSQGVRYLLDHGVNPDGVSEDGLLSLFRKAIEDGHYEIADIFRSMIDVDKYIIPSNPNDYKVLSNFRDLIVGAAAGGSDTLLRKCLERCRILYGSDMYRRNECLSTATYTAARCGQTNSLRIILGHEARCIDSRLRELLQEASDDGKLETFVMLLERVALVNPDFKKMGGLLRGLLQHGKAKAARALLQYSERSAIASDLADDDIFTIAGYGGVATMKVLLEHGVKLDPNNAEHHKAMSDAARGARPDVLKIFLDAGFDANVVNSVKDHGPMNALTEALCDEECEDDGVAAETTADLLLDGGLDIEGRDEKTDETPLLFMAGRDKYIRLGIRRPISCQHRERAVCYLLKKGANMFYQSNRGENPFVKAAVKGHAGVVRIMLEHLDTNCVPLEVSLPFVLSAMETTTYRDVLKVLSRWYWPKMHPCPS